jgi:hypothetical protein
MNIQPHPATAVNMSLARIVTLNRRAPLIAGTCLIFVCAQTVTVSAQTNGGQAAQKNSAAMEWGPLCRGLQLSAMPIANVFSSGDPIKVVVIVTNVTAEPIALPVIFPGSDHRYDVKFVVTDARGQRVPFTQLGSILDGEPKAVSGVEGRFVPPKGVIEDVIRLDNRFELGTTGVFSVTVRRLIPDANSKPVPELISNPAKFEIVPALKNTSSY